MLRYVLSIGAMILAFYMIKWREFIGDAFGDPMWARRLGGIYNLIVYIAVFILFWAIAAFTGTTHILFKPLIYVLPGLNPTPSPLDL